MKRILMSLMMIALVGTLAVGSTKAWFTDQEIVNNTLAAGKLNVDLTGPDAGGITIALDTAQTFEGGLRPGKIEGPYQIGIYNRGHGQSTMPVKYKWNVNYTGGSKALFDLLNVRVRDGNCDWMTTNPGGIVTRYGWARLNNMADVTPAISQLGVNITRCTWFEFQLDSTAGNVLQGKSTQFELVLDATQPENSGWSE